MGRLLGGGGSLMTNKCVNSRDENRTPHATMARPPCPNLGGPGSDPISIFSTGGSGLLSCSPPCLYNGQLLANRIKRGENSSIFCHFYKAIKGPSKDGCENAKNRQPTRLKKLKREGVSRGGKPAAAAWDSCVPREKREEANNGRNGPIST